MEEKGITYKYQTITGYEIFHINRIQDLLFNLQTPFNDHNDDGTSSCGNMTPTNDKRKRLREILASLFELGYMHHDLLEMLNKVITTDERRKQREQQEEAKKCSTMTNCTK